MKYQKLLLVVLLTVSLGACSSNKMGKMAADGIMPQVSAVMSFISAI